VIGRRKRGEKERDLSLIKDQRCSNLCKKLIAVN